MRNLIVCVSFFLCGELQAHSWYDLDCCSGNDCAPVDNIIQNTDSVYAKTIHGIAPILDTTRQLISKDERLHACIIKMKNGDFIRCLYIPPTN